MGAHNLLGAPWLAAVLLGGAVASSSTAITLKQLSDEGDLGSQHSRLAVGILLFQDLASLPFLVLVASAKGGGFDGLALLRQLVVAGVGVTLIASIGQRAFRAALAWAAEAGSPELFLLASLALAIGTAFTAHGAGLSPPIGAFLAGMVVGESDYRHRIEDDLRPFRDVLVGLFFVMIGMQVELAALATLSAAVLGWLLVTQALSAELLDTGTARAMLLALALSMALAPQIIQRSGVIAGWFLTTAARAGRAEPSARSHETALRDNVVLCGVGRVGRLVAVALEMAKLPYIGVESDHARFRIPSDRAITSCSATPATPAVCIGWPWRGHAFWS